MVQRTYGAMTNDVLIDPAVGADGLRDRFTGALVDRCCYSIQLALPPRTGVTRGRDPDRVHVLGHRLGPGRRRGGVDRRHRLQTRCSKAGYDVKLAAGVITAGGTLGILMSPPSVMIIVYAAVAGQSVVKRAAMFPGFFLALLYTSMSSAGR